MTVSCFNSTHNPGTTSILLLTAAWALVFALTTLGLLRGLNERFSPTRLKGPAAARFWALLCVAAGAFFVHRAVSPFYPRWIFGIPFWPERLGVQAAVRHCVVLSFFGSFLVLICSGSGLSGSFERWLPRPSSVWPRLAAAGAALGLAWGVFGACANLALFQIEAVFRMGRHNSGALLALALVGALPLSAALSAYLPLYGREFGAARRAALYAGLLAVWLLPVRAFDAYLRSSWDFGPRSLGEAAGVPPDGRPSTLSVVALSREDGWPGTQRRSYPLAAEGLDASPESLDRIRSYLDSRGYRTLFGAAALKVLRRGWTLNWSPADYMEAAALALGEHPPDYLGFLSSMCAAPATDDNYARLERVARAAWDYPVPDVKQAQRTYEGFSAAYARFGDLERSNAWLERIQRLWPLFEDNVHIEPLEERHDGSISGAVFFEGLPATALKVGLFVLPSTTSAAGATEGLGASVTPDVHGRFAFLDLPPGRYYLALQGEAALLTDGLSFQNPPGALRVRPGEMNVDLLPIEIERRALSPAETGDTKK